MKHLLTLVCFCACASFSLAGGKAESEQRAAELFAEVNSQTMQALRQIGLGHRDEGAAALREIVAEHPDQAYRARWGLGEVVVGEQWMPFDRVVHEPGRWPEVYKYQQEREKYGDTFREQLFLADGCRAHGLFDEQRAHLSHVVQHDWTFAEAHVRLGDVQVDGFWIPARQIVEMQREQRAYTENLRSWIGRIQSLQQQFTQLADAPVRWQPVVDELNSIRTPDAIPAMETCFTRHGERETEFYLNWLMRIDSVQASQAVARQAVLNTSPRLRTLAQQLLRDRRREEFVPVLLSGLKTTEVKYSLGSQAWPLMILTAERQVKVDTEDAEFTQSKSTSVIASDIPGVLLPEQGGLPHLVIRGNVQAGSGMSQKFWGAMQRELQQANQFAAWRNSSDAVRRDRSIRALEQSTEVTGNKSAEDWWAWWRVANGIDVQGPKARVKSQSTETWYVDHRTSRPISGSTGIRTFARNPFSHNCFAPGTLVETEHGPRKIDDVRVGDRVLSQDQETGELQFKPVFNITTSEKADVVKLVTPSETITCSQGHPFWVVDRGWRMAQELEPGMSLHTLDGTQLEVQQVTEAGSGPVLNLVVADFGTYFAGTSRFYTHDVSPRQASDNVIPGLRKEFQ